MAWRSTNESFTEVFAGEYALNLIQPPATVLDIGANEGAFAAWAIEQWPECRVTSFEPVPANAALFRANHGDQPRVTLWQNAVSTSPRVRLVPGLHNSGEWSAFYQPEVRPELAIHVEAVHPANLPAADFVKVDTEGAEIEILEHLDLSATAAVVCEYHRATDVPLLTGILARRGLALVCQNPICPDRGILKFARPGVLHETSQSQNTMIEIPDSMCFTGKTADGKLITLKAVHLRNEHYRPELAGKKLFLGVPVYSQMFTSFVHCLMDVQAHKPCEIEVETGQGDGVARTRNNLTASFLASDATHLLFIDCDLIFSAEHIVSLLRRNLPVVCGFYPKKQQGKLEWVINTLPDNPQPLESGLVPLKYAGTGFLCIAREVFVKMAAQYPEIAYRADYGDRGLAHDFWSMGVYRQKPEDEGRYLSEDWYFCQRWLDMGGEVWGDTTVVLKHQGLVTFPLASQIADIPMTPLKKSTPALTTSDHAEPTEASPSPMETDAPPRTARPVALSQAAGDW